MCRVRANSRWLFFCSLYIPCPSSTSFTDTPFTWLTFRTLAPVPANGYSSFRSELFTMLIKGVVRSVPSAGFSGNWWAKNMSIPPITGNLPPHTKTTASLLSSHLLHTMGYCSRTLLRTCVPPSTKPVMSLMFTLGSVFGLEVGQVQGL